MTLENYESISSEEKLAEELGSAIEWFKIEEWKVAKDAIKNLDAEKLTKFIEKTFNDWWAWSTYSEMRQNKFYPFMVQASIDLLSDTLGDKKYNENWEEDNNWKTLDEYIKECWWIDNQYWPWTKHIVWIVQKILGIHYDMAAGPQFFAKICSVLKWESNVSNFKVKNKDNYKYNFDNWWNNQVNVGYESYQLEWVTLKYNKNKITIENKNDWPYIKYNGKSVKIKINSFKTPIAEWFKFTKNQDGSYTIKNEWENNYKDSINLANKEIKYNKDEIEIQQDVWWIKFRKKWTNNNWWIVTPLENGGYKPVDGFIIEEKDWVLNIRLKSNTEKLWEERGKQEEFLNKTEIKTQIGSSNITYKHKIAYKINNERKYCAYNGDDFVVYDKETKESTKKENLKAVKVYNYINIWGSDTGGTGGKGGTNLQNETYEAIKYINASPTDRPSTKRRYIDNKTSKGWWTKANREILYDRCVKKAADNGKWNNWWDFVAFGDKMVKLGVNKKKITFGTWTSIINVLGDKSIDQIQNIAIV